MEIKASLKHLRMSAQKTRLVVDIVRKLSVKDALDQLKFANKLAAAPVGTLIKSAIANAENTYGLEKSNLYIKEIRVDEGVTLKRWMPRAHGRATSIRKRGCHINLILAEIKDSGKGEKRVVKAAEPVKLEKLVKDSEKTAGKIAGSAKDQKIKSAAGEKTKMFRRKAG
jgi:large subunit ribosomal protein L22